MMDVMEWLRAQLEDIRENARLRLGIWLASGIVLLYLVLVVSDLRAATREQSGQLAARLARLERVADQGDWQAYAEEARARLVNLEQGLWNSSSRGLAQAEFESWVLGRAEESGLQRLKARTENPVAVDEMSGFWMVSTELEADFKPGPLYLFLRRVETNAELVVVSRLDAAGGRRSSRASMTLRAYYRIDDA
jgi:hypothetical protein